MSFYIRCAVASLNIGACYLFQTGCSSGYNLSAYPQLMNMNSQVNEQGNAGTKRIKDQLSYITSENFMKHCIFYLWNKNRLKNQIQ